MNTRERLVEWLGLRGFERSNLETLFCLLEVPAVPEALMLVLERFSSVVGVVSQSVDYNGQANLDELSQVADGIVTTLQAESHLVPPEVFHRYSTLRSLYSKYPTYGVLQRAHGHDIREREYFWLLGLLIIARPHVDDARLGERFVKWAMAVRAFGEKPKSHNDPEAPQWLLSHLISAADGRGDPEAALLSLQEATRSTRRRAHAAYIVRAWRFLAHGERRVRQSGGSGGGGYRPIRGVPPGHLDSGRPTFAHSSLAAPGTPWGSLQAQSSADERDGTSDGGEAPADAAIPGEVIWSHSEDEYATDHYIRGRMWQRERYRCMRVRKAGQDTCASITPWTPQQSAWILEYLVRWSRPHTESRDDVLFLGSRLCLLGYFTGIAQEQFNRVDKVDDPTALQADTARFAFTATGEMVWIPKETVSRLPQPNAQGSRYVRPTTSWIAVATPGILQEVLADWVDAPTGTIVARGCEQSITRALRALSRVVDVPVTWEKLRQHWWGWLAWATEQPSRASAMTGYVRPSTATAQHYLHLSAPLQRSSHESAYHAFVKATRAEYLHRGVDWPAAWSTVAAPRVADARPGHGSPIVPRDQAIAEDLGERVREAGHGLDEDRAVAERLTAALYHSVSLWCGLRGTRVRAAYAATYLRGINTLSEKDQRDYSRARRPPAPKPIAKRLDRLRERREIALNRAGLLPVRIVGLPEMPPQRDECIEQLRRSRWVALSYIGGSTGDELELLTPAAIRQRRGLDFPHIPTNWPRHWLRTRLAEDHQPDQVANAWLGHHCAGQDPWGATSCMRTSKEVQAATAIPGHTIARFLQWVDRSR